MPKKHLLFVCTGNVFRSRQAAELFVNNSEYEARSAGTAPVGDGRPVTQELVDWAGEIFVMSEKEDGHESFLRTHFNVENTPIHVLGIPNMYNAPAEEQRTLRRVLIGKLRDYFPETFPLVDTALSLSPHDNVGTLIRMPIILWLLGVPISIIILLYLFNIIG